MKIEKITDNKIRIILNLDDLKAKNIDLHSFMSNSIESQSLFGEMLDEAEKKVGFYTKDSKIMIEALASSDGFFIFTITKVEEDALNKKKLKIRRKSVNQSSRKAIYKFETFNEFCEYCSYIKNNISLYNNLSSLFKKSSLYLYETTYYLVISDINIDFPNLSGFYSTIAEFAKLASSSEEFESKLLEFGKPIMKRNAIIRSIEYFG